MRDYVLNMGLRIRAVVSDMPSFSQASQRRSGIVNLLSEARNDAEMERPGYAAIWTPAMSFHAFSASARSAR